MRTWHATLWRPVVGSFEVPAAEGAIIMLHVSGCKCCYAMDPETTNDVKMLDARCIEKFSIPIPNPGRAKTAELIDELVARIRPSAPGEVVPLREDSQEKAMMCGYLLAIRDSLTEAERNYYGEEL